MTFDYKLNQGCYKNSDCTGFNTRGKALKGPRTIRWSVVVAITSLVLAGCSSDDGDNSDGDNSMPVVSNVPQDSVSTPIGRVWVAGDDNMTLYILPDDAPNTVTCTDGCADAWPPLTTDVTQSPGGPFGLIERPEGTMQWTFKGYPLYYYREDQVSGDTNGEGLGGRWFVARPDPVTSANTVVGETLVGFGQSVSSSGQAAQRVPFDGHTLYFFDPDPVGETICFDACELDWPPLYADTGAVAFGNLSLVNRPGQAKQWAYQGKPLYYYVNDSQPGDILGDVITDWTIATP